MNFEQQPTSTIIKPKHNNKRPKKEEPTIHEVYVNGVKVQKIIDFYNDLCMVYNKNKLGHDYTFTYENSEDKNKIHWLKAAQNADELHLDYFFYLKAQFYWFHKWFKKHPRPRDLCSRNSKVNSLVRALTYFELINKGKINKNHDIVGEAEVKLNKEEKENYNKSLMEDLIRFTGLDKDSVLAKFSHLFNKSWIKKQSKIK